MADKIKEFVKVLPITNKNNKAYIESENKQYWINKGVPANQIEAHGGQDDGITLWEFVR